MALAVAADVELQVALNIVERNGNQQIIDIVATEVRVAVGGGDLEDAVVELENRNVESAATEIVDGDDSVLVFVEAVGKRSRGRFVDETKHVESGDAAGIFCGLALRIVEICGNGDDGLRYRAAEKTLGVALQLAKDEGRNFGRRIGALADPDAENFAGLQIVGETKRKQLQLVPDIFKAAPHQPFHGVDSALRSLDQKLARRIADDDLIVAIKRDDRGHQIQPVFARDDGGRLSLHEGHERVRRAQVDADNVISSRHL